MSYPSRYAKSVFILTRQGIVADVKYIEGCNSGDEILSTRFKYISTNIRYALGIFLVFLLIGSILFSVYERSGTKMVINATSQINLKINDFNKVVGASSPWEKGKLLISTEKIEHKNLGKKKLKTQHDSDCSNSNNKSTLLTFSS